MRRIAHRRPFVSRSRRPLSRHTGEGLAGGFAGGFAHPLLGPDHIAAMLAVGLWGAFLGMPAMLILPVVFPLVMALGGVLGILGIPLPGIEIGIAVSAIVLGLMVALAAKPQSVDRGDCWSAFSRSSTATRMAPNCRTAPTRSPIRSAL